MRYIMLLLVSLSAHAAEPWQSVLILNEDENVGTLLESCEFKGTVAASGVVSRLTRKLAEESIKLGANTVQISRTVDMASSIATGTRAAVNGRAFLCKR